MTNNLTNKIIGIVAVIALAVSVTAYFKNPVVTMLGASSGTEHSFRESFSGGATFGGSIATTSGVSAYALAAKDVASNPTVISWTPNVNTTLTIGSTSTLSYVPNIGDTATIYIRNASTTAGATITFAAADSGMDLQFAEATGGDLVLNGLDWSKVTLIHTSRNLVTMILDEMTEAD